jgi:hypothetical protein
MINQIILGISYNRERNRQHTYITPRIANRRQEPKGNGDSNLRSVAISYVHTLEANSSGFPHMVSK